MQNLPGSYIISIDPGFDHLAILTMVFKIDAPNRQIYLQVLSSSVNDIGEPSENVVQLSIAPWMNVLKRTKFTLCQLIELCV